MGNFSCGLRSRFAGASLLLFALLWGTPGSAQTGVPSVSTRLTLSGVFQGTAVVRPPQENLAADEVTVVSYPADALSDGVEGTVKLKLLIGADGSIKQSEALDNGGDSRLLNASVEGFRRVGFLPGTVDGVPTEMPVLVEIRFAINYEGANEGADEEEDMPGEMAPLVANPPDGVLSEKPPGVNDLKMDDFVAGAIPPQFSMSELRGLIQYPAEAQEDGREGEVVVSVEVDVDGRVLNAVLRRSTASIFNASALAAAWKLTYTPATQNGKPIRMWVTYRIAFQLAG